MKKILCLGILLIAGFSLIHADVIPAGHHVVSRVVTIANCDDYPGYTLVGYITGPMIADYDLQIIEQDVPLNKGYKFNEMKLYAVHQDVIETIGRVEDLNFSELTQIIAPVEIIDPGPFVIEDANPLVKETVVYTIWGEANGELILYISERRLDYNNGAPPTVEHYTYTPLPGIRDTLLVVPDEFDL